MMLTELRHQGSTAEKSSAQKLNQGSSRECAEIDEGDSRRQIKNIHALSNIIRGGLFLVLFWTSKKVQKEILVTEDAKQKDKHN
jgi:hypothetical protein